MRTLIALLLLSNFTFAQPTITFRDDVKLTLKGDNIGSYILYDYIDPTKEEKRVDYYCFSEKDVKIIYEYSTWLTEAAKGKMDELRIYTIRINQLEKNAEILEETDEYGKLLVYSLNLQSLDENQFSCVIYDKYSSTPKENRPLTYITVYSIDKNKFEQLAKELVISEIEPD